MKEAIPVDEVARFDGDMLTHRSLKRRQSTMQAFVFGGVGKVELEDIPKPRVDEPTDALVKISRTTIFGADLGILHGNTPTCKPGRWA